MILSMKIVIDKDIPFIHGIFEEYFNEVVYSSALEISNQLLVNASALVIRTRTLCNEELLQGTKVEIIATATVGTDHIDLNFCQKRGIKVLSAQGCNKGAVLQWVLAALSSAANYFQEPLQGKIMGIVGNGNIGSLVSKAAKAIGMDTLICDPVLAEIEGNCSYTSLDNVAENADFISFHVPLTYMGNYPTFNMAADDFFSRIKVNSFILNSSRGGVVNENLMVQSYQKKRIRGMAIDVWFGEPLILDILLNECLIATPHVAGYSIEGKINATLMAVMAIANHFNFKLNSFKPSKNPIEETIELNCSQFITNNSNLNLHSLMNRVYNIASETKCLKNEPQNFEKIRNNYAYRRENSGYFLSGCRSDLVNVINNLGFKV